MAETRLRSLKFEQTKEGVKLTGYAPAPHGRKYRVGSFTLARGVSLPEAAKAGGVLPPWLAVKK
jgi:hypothetical protein